MEMPQISRRDFLLTGAALAAGSTALAKLSRPVVSIVRIKNDKVGMAVEQAIDLLGGIKHVTKGKHSVMLKPNLVSSDPKATTKPDVVRAIAQLMQRAGKEVSIGEGSAAAPKFNLVGRRDLPHAEARNPRPDAAVRLRPARLHAIWPRRCACRW